MIKYLALLVRLNDEEWRAIHMFCSHFCKIESDKSRVVCRLRTVLVLSVLFQLFILMFTQSLFGVILVLG